MRGTCWVGFVPTFYFGFKAMERNSLADRIDNLATRAASDNGVEFLHAEIVGNKRNMTVRIYIDKPEGVTIEDCSMVSRAIETVMDEDDFVPSAYVLEVSSPGLERPLFNIGDYAKFTGKKAKITTIEPLDGQANFTGRINGVEGGEIVFEDKTSGPLRIPFDKIGKANLKVDLTEEFKKKR